MSQNKTGYAYLLGEPIVSQNQKYINDWEVLKNKEGYRPDVFIREAGYKGLGVYANKDYSSGDVIEYAHSLILSWGAEHQRDKKVLQYAYAIPCYCKPSSYKPPCLLNCPENGHRWIMPLGYGSIYNCGNTPEEANMGFIIVPEDSLMVFIANKNISVGTELVTWWGKGYYDKWCKNKGLSGGSENKSNSGPKSDLNSGF